KANRPCSACCTSACDRARNRRRRPSHRPSAGCCPATTPPRTPSAASQKTRRSGDRPRKRRPATHPSGQAARAATRPPRSEDMATVEVKVPDIGGYDDVPVIEVLVAVGDTVAKDQGLVTLESDKATMEVPSAVAGVVKELKVKIGDTLSEGKVVALIEVAEEAAKPAAAAAPAAPAKVEPAAETGARVEPVAVAPVPDKLAQREIAQEQALPAGKPATPPVQFNAEGVLPSQVPYASPAVRVFARELGVDLSQLTGTEKGGRITKGDVQKFVKAALGGGVVAGAPAGGGNGLNLLPWPKVDFSKFGETETQPLSRIKKI